MLFSSSSGAKLRACPIVRRSPNRLSQGNDPFCLTPSHSPELPVDHPPERLPPMTKAPLLFDTVYGSASLDLEIRKVSHPPHSIAIDPIVGLTSQAPVSNRRRDGDGLPIENHFPVGGIQWRHHLVPTSTATLMHKRGEGYRHVQHAII